MSDDDHLLKKRLLQWSTLSLSDFYSITLPPFQTTWQNVSINRKFCHNFKSKSFYLKLDMQNDVLHPAFDNNWRILDGIENVSTLLSHLRYYGTWRGRRQHCDFNLDSEGHLLWLLASLSSFRAEKNRGKTLLCCHIPRDSIQYQWQRWFFCKYFTWERIVSIYS